MLSAVAAIIMAGRREALCSRSPAEGSYPLLLN